MVELPKWEEFMLPLLRVMSDGVTRGRRQLNPAVGRLTGLSEEQMQERLPAGDLTYENRIGWGLSFLTNVGALERPTRGQYVITDVGRELTTMFPDGIRERDIKALGNDPTSPIRPYVSTVRRPVPLEDSPITDPSPLTPTEQVENGVARMHADVAAELLARLQGKEPAFFEEAVVKLLLAMGYGGTTGSGAVTQLTNDGGIDGVIDQDVLGLSRVYVQAKRYGHHSVVQRPEVQSFAGAVHGRADSGVFITTSRFSTGARQFADSTPTRIILIDGDRLADLMIRYGVGVQVSKTYTVVELDEDFFA